VFRLRACSEPKLKFFKEYCKKIGILEKWFGKWDQSGIDNLKTKRKYTLLAGMQCPKSFTIYAEV